MSLVVFFIAAIAAIASAVAVVAQRNPFVSALALLGNCLCVPRALWSRDAAWAFGTTWGALSMGWGNLLCCFLGRSAETG